MSTSSFDLQVSDYLTRPSEFPFEYLAWLRRLFDEETTPPIAGITATYFLTGTNITHDATTHLSWSFGGGTALLNITSPTQPSALRKGIYHATFSLVPVVAFSAGKSWSAGFSAAGSPGFITQNGGTQPSSTSGFFGKIPYGAAGSTGMFAGDGLAVTLTHDDTVDHSFSGDVYLVYLPINFT